ncbi:hypothetical protein [Arenibacter certesii]|uniref:Adenylosuccinate lyase n=1 Tax=Arenibacter certesii TaxID=228955 RepID=A0A918J347_9FLAO|nr:hypothetical protein [Arenibacter certesii]GGW40603.1 hypothetical protein GCM10007383_26720 [Arenibacter certesii]
MKMPAFVINHPENIGNLLEIALNVSDPISCKAWSVMEFIAKQRLIFLLPHTAAILENSTKTHHDAAVRPIAKIYEYLCQSYFIDKDPSTCNAFQNEHFTQMATVCFDWLIDEQKVAAKAYSMTCLLLLGRKFDWIWPELRQVLHQNYQKGSRAYQARARMILAKLGWLPQESMRYCKPRIYGIINTDNC